MTLPSLSFSLAFLALIFALASVVVWLGCVSLNPSSRTAITIKKASVYGMISAIAIIVSAAFFGGRPPAFCPSGEKPWSDEKICEMLVSGIKRDGFLDETGTQPGKSYTCSIDRSFTAKAHSYGHITALFSNAIAVSFTYATSDKAKKYHGSYPFWYEDIEMTPCGYILGRGGIGE